MTATDGSSLQSHSYRFANTSGHLYAATTAIMVICSILLALRLYARSLTSGRRGWDDFFLIPSWITLMGVCILMFVAIPRAGIGRHLSVVLAEDPQTIVTWNLVIYVLDWFYVPSNMFSRLSIVALYLRIFPDRNSRRCSWVIIAYLICNCLAFIITANIECYPFEKIWDKKHEGKCFNIELWWKLSNPPNIIADVAILVLPMGKIWRLNASRAKKLGICFVCLTGSIGLFASCMRTGSFFQALAAKPPDPTWTSSPLLVWTVVECGMYNAAACLVCLRPLYAKIPRYILNHLRSQKGEQISHSRKRGYGITTIGSRKLHRRWLQMDREEERSISYLNLAATSDNLELVTPQPVKTKVSRKDRIQLDTTFDVTSTSIRDQPLSIRGVQPDTSNVQNESMGGAVIQAGS